jgi:hypothetical protein
VENWQFYRHMPVYLADGRVLGRTVEVGHAVDVVHVQEGRIRIIDWYIPVDAIRQVDADGIHLAVNHDALRANGWNVPPLDYLMRQGATPGYEFTSRADIPEYAGGEGSPSSD